MTVCSLESPAVLASALNLNVTGTMLTIDVLSIACLAPSAPTVTSATLGICAVTGGRSSDAEVLGNSHHTLREAGTGAGSALGRTFTQRSPTSVIRARATSAPNDRPACKVSWQRLTHLPIQAERELAEKSAWPRSVSSVHTLEEHGSIARIPASSNA